MRFAALALLLSACTQDVPRPDAGPEDAAVDPCSLCGSLEKCVKGKCYATRCGGECAAGKICIGGACADEACAEVTCPAGVECVAGQCTGCRAGYYPLD